VAEAAEEDQDSQVPGYVPSQGDERERLFRQIRARRGQRAFREKLRARYGDRCAISGCNILDVLEAAHIRPYRGDLDNHVENGLLLRADLHTLFDLDLIGIEPFTLTVHLNPEVSLGEYPLCVGPGSEALLCWVQGRSPVVSTKWSAKHMLFREAPYEPYQAISKP
jgi:HNH endonuclease